MKSSDTDVFKDELAKSHKIARWKVYSIIKEWETYRQRSVWTKFRDSIQPEE